MERVNPTQPAQKCPLKNISSLSVKIDIEAEAYLIAMACSEAPPGYHRWTLRLFAEQMVVLEQVEKVFLTKVLARL